MRRLRRPSVRRARNGLAAVCACLAVSAAAPAPAPAVTLWIGQTASDPLAACGDLLLFNATTADGGNLYLVPAGTWTLDSYAIHGGSRGGVGALVVLRQLPSLFDFEVVYSSAPRSLAPGVVNTFPASAVVSGGDVLALWMGSGECGAFTGAPDDFVTGGAYTSPPEAGEIVTVVTGLSGFRINIAARLTAIEPPPPPPRVAVCTQRPVVRSDGTLGYFADVLLSQLNTTNEASPYYGAQPAIFVEGYGLVCQISDIVTYGGNPARFRDSGLKVDSTGIAPPPELASVWSAPYPYWTRITT